MQNQSESYNDLGNQLYQQGDLLGAQRCYLEAIAQQGDNPQSYYNLGVVLNAQGKLEDAQELYQTAITLKPDYLKAYSNLGCVLVKLNKISEAIAVYHQAISLDANWATLHNNLGQALQAQGKPGEALSAYTKAIALQPDRVFPYYNAGKIWQHEGQQVEAIRYFQRCIELDPHHPAAYTECGYSLMVAGQLEAAMKCFQKAIALQPAFVESYCAWVERTLAIPDRPGPLDERDRAQISCAAFLKALQRDPASPEVYSHFAQTYQHWGNVLFQYGGYEKAEHYYHQSLQINPKNLTVYRQLSQCLAKQNRLDAAAVVSHMATLMEPSLSQDKISAELDNRSAEESLDWEGIALKRHTPPQGFYLHSGDWIEAVKFEGSDYILIHLGRVRRRGIPAPEFRDSSECGGLNCAPCLNRIYQQLSPTHWGHNIYHFNHKNARAIAEDSPPQFVVVVPQGRVWIVPQTNSWMVCNAIALVTPDNYLLADVSRQYPGALPGCQKQDPTEHQIFELEDFPPLTEIEGTVAVLAGLSGNIYFHWLVDILPRLEILRQAGIKWEEIDYFLVNSIREPFQRETLAQLGIPEAKIIESDRYPHISATQLIVPSFPGHLGWLEPWALTFLRQAFLNSVPASDCEHPERIYIRRSTARNRRLINEEEVIEFLAQFGFEPIEPESLSFVEQIAVFSQAKIIVAPHGSGLTNLVFCRPGTQAIELVSPHYVRPYYAVICQLLGFSHYALMGEAFACYPIREVMYQNSLTEDIQINVERLHALLKLAGIIESNFSGAVSPTMQATFNSETAAEQLNQQAEVYLAQGKLDEAESVCLKAMQIQPNSASSYKNLGTALQRKGKIKEAQQSYLKAIKINPNFAAVYANLGSLYGQQRQWEATIASYQRAININPKFAGAYRNLAKVWTQLKKPAEAADCWYLAWSLEPEKFSAVECVNLGNALVQQREMTRAIACYRYALELNPNLVGVYHNLEEALKRQGKVEEAAIYGRKAVELRIKSGEFRQYASQRNGRKTGSDAWVEDAEALVHLGEYYYQKGKFAEAIVAVEKAVSVQPNLALAYKILGNARLANRQLEAAQQCYLKALEIQPDFAEVYGNLGTVLAQQQNWEKAILAYQKALELQPTFAGAYRNLAKVLERVGKVQEAGICRYQALSLEPLEMTAEECLKLGNSLIGQGKQEEAIACYQRAVELNPLLSPAYHNLGEIFSNQQEWEAAIAAYQQAIAVKAENGRSYYGLAKALVELERWEEAVKAYQQAIQLNVTSTEIYHQLGDALQKLQRWEEAATAYRQAIALNADNSWSHNNLGDALTKLQQWEEAVVAYRRAIALNPEFSWSYYNLGDVLIKLQRWEESVSVYRCAVELNPQLPGIEKKLARALRERARLDLDVAANWARQAVTANPDEVEEAELQFLDIKLHTPGCYLQLGKRLVEHNRLDEAISIYKGAIDVSPNDPEIYFQLGKAFAQKKDPERALAAYRRAVEVDPKHYWSHHHIAEVLAEKGQLNEAIDSYFRAIETNPSPSFWHYHNLAQVQVRKGELEQAIASYRKAIEVNPDYSWSYRNLGDILATQGKTDEATVCYRRAIKLKPRIF
ncbi:tetratricopeptide repeat protein [Oscillatoria acuminata]|uniref:Capsular polysaccharide biosynthesis protein n=1 Tax=Oscillatoria acuminata PCC 6304 TaxID=56110 RepID=K9TST2_9CYAN|nr:tetratricopeptide repeat protein [Oscillatoria acuminata]AFY85468.1 capsular polysaccharide biosynthesis protein [Oscillatoria acuminata PCC 6304]